MIILTGPQVTSEQRHDLASLAKELDAVLIDDDVTWASVTEFYVLPGWDTCPSALADVGIAAAFGLRCELISS